MAPNLRSPGTAPIFRVSLALGIFAACSSPASESAKGQPAAAAVAEKAPEKAPAPTPETPTAVPEAGGAKEPPAVPPSPGATEGSPAAGEHDEPGEKGVEEAKEAAKPTAPAEPAPTAEPTVKELLGRVAKSSTSDEDARATLEAAEKRKASARALARAATARGEALLPHPDRAAAFFEWAADKDPRAPEPVFHLARLAVMRGDIPTTIEFLEKTHARGGKGLLDQLGFDQTWELVKDDPAVRKLLR